MRARSLIAGSIGIAMAASLIPGPAAGAAGTPVQVLLPGNRIVTVTTAEPSKATSDVKVLLPAGDTLVGIDRRPAGGGLVYGVAKATNGTNVYTIDSAGIATFAFSLIDTAGAPVSLVGTSFGVDFNPAADALRIVSDAGQNLRALPSAVTPAGVPRAATGTTFRDLPLNTTPGPVAEPIESGVVAAAYTNNDTNSATGTLLLDIDSDDDVLWDQNPPNDGDLINARPLGIPTSSFAAFDIQTVGTTNTAYAILGQENGKSGVSRLVIVDTATGGVTELGALGKYRNAIGMAL